MSEPGGGDRTRSFRPGSWFGIFGDHATVLLPPSEKPRVAALWELVDDGAGFDEVLDALVAGGLRELPGFVLVSERDGETRVVLRGAARATFVAGGETVELEGSPATTWVERALTGVSRMLVQVADVAEGPDHTIAGGLVRLGRVDEPSCSAGPRLVDAEASPVGDDAADEADVEPADDGAGTQDAPADGVSSVVEATPLEEPAAEAVANDEDTEDDDLLRHELPTEAVDIPASWAPPARSRDDDAPAPAVAPLAFSTGERVDVDRPILIGRAPRTPRATAAPRAAGAAPPSSGPEPRLVTVPSPHQEVSSTHLEVRPGSGADDGTAVATDLGSTNGTVVVQPGLPPDDLLAGIAVPLLPGAVLDLGDGVTIQVSTP